MVRKGSITIHAVLILGVMMTLIVTCLTSARMAAARTQIAESAGIGLFSVLCGFRPGRADRFSVRFKIVPVI